MSRAPDSGPPVLIAEDDDDIAGLLALSLGREGVDVVIARDGEETLELARACRPNIAFIDIHMPVLDGYEVTRRIRADDELRAMRIVIVSATVTAGSTADALEAGADAFIKKPFGQEELRAQLERASEQDARADSPS